MASEKGLTPAQERFSQEVAAGKSQAEAYRTAYPKSTRWKDAAVWVAASKLMDNPKVSVRVKALQEQHAAKLEITAERVLKEVARIAFFDIRRIFNEDGTLKKVWELDDDTAAAIAGIEAIDIGGDGQLMISKKFKVADKNVALEKLVKHLGLYELDNKQKTDPVAELLQQLGGRTLGVSGGEGDGE